MTEKDYSLLRPFDLEAAKAGAKVCYGSNGDCESVTFLAEAGPDGDHAIRDHEGNCYVEPDYGLKMAPLCWVEGRPVYPGDALERENGKAFIPDMVAISGELRMLGEGLPSFLNPELLRWPRPKPVKRWINIYPANSFESQDAANEYAMSSRIACIEIELPPLPAK